MGDDGERTDRAQIGQGLADLLGQRRGGFAAARLVIPAIDHPVHGITRFAVDRGPATPIPSPEITYASPRIGNRRDAGFFGFCKAYRLHVFRHGVGPPATDEG